MFRNLKIAVSSKLLLNIVKNVAFPNVMRQNFIIEVDKFVMSSLLGCLITKIIDIG